MVMWYNNYIKRKEAIKMNIKIEFNFSFLIMVLQAIFIILKAVGFITWNWFLVFSPFLVFVAFIIISIIIIIIIS